MTAKPLAPTPEPATSDACATCLEQHCAHSAHARQISHPDSCACPDGTPRLRLARTMTVEPARPPHLGILADRGATVVVGRGGVGKGVWALWIAKQTALTLGWKTLYLDFERRDYEFKPRLDTMLPSWEHQGLIAYYTPSYAPIWDQVDEIRAALSAADFTPDNLVIDSAARATGVDISTGDNTIPSRYYEALDQLCERHLTVAHFGRNSTAEQPMGAQRWFDDARTMTTYTEKARNRVLTFTKNNQGPLPAPLEYEIVDWKEVGRVKYVTDLRQRSYAESMAETVERIVTQPMLWSAIKAAVNAGLDDKAKHLDNTIQRGLARSALVRIEEGKDPLWAPPSAKATIVPITRQAVSA